MTTSDPTRHTPGTERNSRRSWGSPRDSFSKLPLAWDSSHQDNGLQKTRGGNRRVRHNHRSVASTSASKVPQLANIKKQWDVDRDIPTGFVRNNRFTPKTHSNAPSKPPPQLLHQKRQWDTRDIPRGAVASRVMRTESSTENTGVCAGNEPGWVPCLQVQQQRGFSALETSTSPRPRTDTAVLRGGARFSVRAVPPSRTALRGRLIENPNFQHRNNMRDTLTPNEQSSSPVSGRWEPSLEIPKGTVKGRVSTLLANSSPDEREKNIPSLKAEMSPDSMGDEYPWTITSQASLASQVLPGNSWNAAARATRSKQFGMREAPVNNCIEIPDKDSIPNVGKFSSDPRGEVLVDLRMDHHQPASIIDSTQVLRNVSPTSMSTNSTRPVTEERICEDASVAKDRHSDVLRMSQKRQTMTDIAVSNSGDHEVLQAARKKMSLPSKSCSRTILANADSFQNEIGWQGISISAMGVIIDPNLPVLTNEGCEMKDAKLDENAVKSSINIRSASRNGEKSLRALCSGAGTNRLVRGSVASCLGPTTQFVSPSEFSQKQSGEDAVPTKLPNVPIQPAVDAPPSHHVAYSEYVPSKDRHEDGTAMSDLTLPQSEQVLELDEPGDQQLPTKSIVLGEHGSSETPAICFTTARSSSQPIQHKNYVSMHLQTPSRFNVKSLISTAGRESPPYTTRMASQVHAAEHLDPDSIGIRVAAEDFQSERTSKGAISEVTSCAYVSGGPFGGVFDDKKEIPRSVLVCPEIPAFEEPSLDHLQLVPTDIILQPAIKVESVQKPKSDLTKELIISRHQFSAAKKRRMEKLRKYTKLGIARQPAQGFKCNLNARSIKNSNDTVNHFLTDMADTHGTHESKLNTEYARPRSSRSIDYEEFSDVLQNSESLQYNSPKPSPSPVDAIPVKKIDFIDHASDVFFGPNQIFRPFALPIVLKSTSSGRKVLSSVNESTTADLSGECCSSVGSDIRILRSILRRPRRSSAHFHIRSSHQTFEEYDESAVTDPMQRAGLRLLSAAIIPIQSEVRRFLSMRRALTRMWALIVIQTYCRRWSARHYYINCIISITKVQSMFRGIQVRSMIQDQAVCAVEIQRYMRGYLATMRVYEEIYKVTIVQSFVRMKLAINLATHKMALVIQLQSFCRGFLCRRKFLRNKSSAISIQASWRCFFVRLGYQFDLLDIIITQSAWRRRCARREARRRRHAIWVRCATRIQSQWRSYDCTMNYLHYLADVLVIQSAVRRFLAWKRVERLRCHAATVIQSSVRGFINKRSLLEFLSARKIQTLWRGYTCYHGRKAYFAARCIQACWRGYVSFRDATGAIAARLIQAHWRGHLCCRRLRHYKAARSIQASWRRFVCYQKTTVFYAARAIQSFWRRHRCVQLRRRYYASRTIQSFWRGYVCVMDLKEYYASRTIQSAWRSFVCYADFMFTIADVVIVQKLARRWLATRVATKLRIFRAHQSAKLIQMVWRNFINARKIQRTWNKFRFRLHRDKAATIIQKNWRCFVDETEYVVLRYESYAARTIQTYWRRFWCFSNFIIALDCAIQIQAVFRGFLQRRALDCQYGSAASIQSGCRIFLAKHEASRASMIQALLFASNTITCRHNEAAALIQRLYKGIKARNDLRLYQSARSIQCFVRGRQARIAVTLYLAARTIQKAWRGFHPRRFYESYVAARCIQNFWRYKTLSSKYRHNRAAVILQSFWRCKMLFVAYSLYRSALKIQTKYRSVMAYRDLRRRKRELVASTLIQSSWRGFVCYTDYIFTIADIVAVQKVVRGYMARNLYAGAIESRMIEHRQRLFASTLVQKVCRGFICRQRYWYTLGCTMQIQSWIRGRMVVVGLRRESTARLALQSYIRRYLAKQEVSQRQFIYMLIKSADRSKMKRAAVLKIQRRWKVFVKTKRREDAARAIQRFFLMVKLEVDRMVFSAKRRHQWRRRIRAKTNRNEDALLEDAWQSAVSNLGSGHSFGSANQRGPCVGSFTKSFCAESKEHRLRRTVECAEIDLAVLRQDSTQQHRLPPRRGLPQDTPSTVVPLHEDDHSELSGLTASTAANYLRLPPSRIGRLNSVEIDEDMELEEAFIDAEIYNAKERRLSERNWGLQPPYSCSPTSARRSRGSVCSRSRRVRVSATTTTATN